MEFHAISDIGDTETVTTAHLESFLLGCTVPEFDLTAAVALILLIATRATVNGHRRRWPLGQYQSG